jgi:drug/metabolite transporter (DMT)-like permease
MGIPALVTATGSQLGATLGLAMPTLWFWPVQTPSTQAWLALLALGVLCTGVAYVLYFKLIESVGPARALTVTFIAPVFALFYGRLFLDESVSQWMVICGLVIVVGTMLSTGLIAFNNKLKPPI